MTYQKVKMVVEFTVPVGEEHYGLRTAQAHWKQYAEHDMLEHLKAPEDITDVYREAVNRRSAYSPRVSFEWLDEFEQE